MKHQNERRIEERSQQNGIEKHDIDSTWKSNKSRFPRYKIAIRLRPHERKEDSRMLGLKLAITSSQLNQFSF